MKVTDTKDYSEDDSTHTLKIVTGITEHNCIISERSYEYLDDEDTVCLGLAIELETFDIDTETQVYRTLEDLQAECDGK